jgi:hypothetical protein
MKISYRKLEVANFYGVAKKITTPERLEIFETVETWKKVDNPLIF